MPKKIIAALLSVLVIMTAFVVPAFAAEGDSVEEQPIQYANNLIPFPYVKMEQELYGVTFTGQDDGGIHIVGTPSTSFSWNFAVELYLKTEEYYTLSAKYVEGDTMYYEPDEVNIIARKRRADGTESIWLNLKDSFNAGDDSATGRLLEGENIVWMAVTVQKDVPTDVVVYPMFNIGQSPSPYMLYLPYLLNQKFQEGYDQGYEEGYQPGYDEGYKVGEGAGIIQGTESGYSEGYQAGLDASSTPINLFDIPFKLKFNGIVVDSTGQNTVSYGGTSSGPFVSAVDELEIPVVKAGDEVNVSAAVNYLISDYEKRTGASADGVSGMLKFVFDVSSSVSGAFFFTSADGLFDSICPYGSAGAFGLKGVKTDGTVIEFDLNSSVIGPVAGPSGVDLYAYSYSYKGNLDITEIAITEIGLGLNDSIYEYALDYYVISYADVKTPSFMAGYNKGYQAGAENGVGKLKEVYYDQGYNQGFKYGKQEGLKIAESGGWNSLMIAIVEAPVNAFQGLFNFEILGLDMRVAVGSILTLCVVIIVIKKVIL